MRYGILADIHANLEALEAVLEACREERIDKYICLGDIVGYAANPAECIEKIRGIVTISIVGNHDRAGVGLLSLDHFNIFAKEAMRWTIDKLDSAAKDFLTSLELIYQDQDLIAVHGTLVAPQKFDYFTDEAVARDNFTVLKKDICFIGHTHIAGYFSQDKNGRIKYSRENLLEIEPGCRYFINAGSVGQPRDGNPDAAYCIFDTENRTVETRRVGYDIQAAREKIIAAGLPEMLGDRLLSGK